MQYNLEKLISMFSPISSFLDLHFLRSQHQRVNKVEPKLIRQIVVFMIYILKLSNKPNHAATNSFCFRVFTLFLSRKDGFGIVYMLKSKF